MVFYLSLGPVDRDCLVDLMALTVISGVKNFALLSWVREWKSVEDLSVLSSMWESADVGVVFV